MSENVTVVPELTVKPSALKRWSKRTLIVAAVATVGALAYLKVRGSDDEPENTETTQA